MVGHPIEIDTEGEDGTIAQEEDQVQQDAGNEGGREGGDKGVVGVIE